MSETIIIKNEALSVIALKAIAMPTLRLMPGYNTVEKKDLERYFDGNPAAKGQQKMYLSVVDGGELSSEDKAKADAAKEKNDKLNKAQKLIAKQNKAIKEHTKNDSKKDKKIADLETEIKEMKKAIKTLEPKDKKDSKDTKDKKDK